MVENSFFACSDGSDLRKPYRLDQAMWDRLIECGVLENPANEPPADVFEWTNAPESVGSVDHTENRLVGMKSREMYGCRAEAILIEAHRELEKSVLTLHEIQFEQQIDTDSLIAKTQERVSGEIKLKTYRGMCALARRSSPLPLYDVGFATYATSTVFDEAWSNARRCEFSSKPIRYDVARKATSKTQKSK